MSTNEPIGPHTPAHPDRRCLLCELIAECDKAADEMDRAARTVAESFGSVAEPAHVDRIVAGNRRMATTLRRAARAMSDLSGIRHGDRCQLTRSPAQW